jgi:predicted SAM-dependent methyltransferase
MKLVIGCGPWSPQPNTIGLDIIPEFHPDVVRDIKRGLPFNDESFEELNCEHVLEHIEKTEDFVFIMWEIWRVMKYGGIVYIEVPHKDAQSAYESIEHVRYFTQFSFSNFYDNRYAKEMNYPQFTPVDITTGERNGHKTVNVKLQK